MSSALAYGGDGGDDEGESPHGVVSLLEMLRLNATAFASIAADLGQIRFEVCETLHFKPELGNQRPPDDILLKAKNFFKAAVFQLEQIGCRNTAQMAMFYLRSDDKQILFSNLQSALDGVMLSLLGELAGKLFFQLTGDTARLYSESPTDLFGSDVATAFPSARNDIQEAGNCLALNRWPACVFHCMRVLEIGLNALAKRFGASSINWHNIIQECEAEIKKLTNKDEQKFYSEAARHFMFLKDGWRNHIMHVRDEFDEGRALSVWQHTKEFMQQISKRLSE